MYPAEAVRGAVETCRGVVWFWIALLLAAPPAAAGERTCPIPSCDPRLIAYRTARAVRVSSPIRVDGRLDEPAWADAPILTDFVQRFPLLGAAAKLRTEARVLVDDEALYVGVRLRDSNPAGIAAPFMRRDNEGVSDWVFVEFDSRHDRRTAYSLGVNPRGVQADGLYTDDSAYDYAWNAVWEAATTIDAEGWSAEFRIPFSQIVFAAPDSGNEAVWGFNVYRFSPQHGEVSNWSPRFPGLPGVVSQFNELRLAVPSARRRLDVTPFVAPRLERGYAAGAQHFGAGADVVAGLGPGFTLAATVLPDFGQVEADPSQINLTTFEVFQPERRPFFVEGMEAFTFDTGVTFSSRGSSFEEDTPFYSRRLGGPPRGVVSPPAGVADVPQATPIVGAARLTGRTQAGWNVGVFGALTGSDEASAVIGPRTVAIPVEPAALTTVARVSRAFRGGESSFGGIVAGIGRFDLDGDVGNRFAKTAWTFGLDGRHRFAGGRYEMKGSLLGSTVHGRAPVITALEQDPRHGFTRPDASNPIERPDATSLNGLAGQIRVADVSGSFQWGATAKGISPGFETNDIGFQRNADWLVVKGDWRYEHAIGGRMIRRYSVGSDRTGLGWTTAGEPRARTLDGYGRIDFSNYWDATLSWMHEFPAFSMEWLRGGPALRLPARDSIGLVVNTDMRKASHVSVQADAATEPGSVSRLLSIGSTASVRINDHVEGGLGPAYSDEVIGWHYVAGSGAGPYVVSRLRQQTASLIARADIVLNIRTLLQVYVQPLVGVGRAEAYERLIAPRADRPGDRFAALDPGSMSLDPLTGTISASLGPSDGRSIAFRSPDAVRRSLNATVVLRWEYRHGCFLTGVWTRGSEEETARRTTLSDAINGFRVPRGSDVLLLKISVRLAR